MSKVCDLSQTISTIVLFVAEVFTKLAVEAFMVGGTVDLHSGVLRRGSQCLE